MLDRPLVAIAIVTYNSSRFIRQCLRYAFEQDYHPLKIIAIDNASSDGTPDILREFASRMQTAYNLENTGFAAGQNQAIALANADWVLTLNPDVRLSPNFVSELVAAGQMDSSVGSVCGKLLAMSADFERPASPVFDSTGIYFTPNLRHFDRGSREPDRHQYERLEHVFGATGAACLYRREMIEDISVAGEFFDADFFAYREDADVAWRAQLRGWKCLYTPFAIAHHVRTVLPENRSALPAVINMHSVKNRWLLRIKNMTVDLYRRHWLSITARDCVVIAACLLREFRSLRAFVLLFRAWRRAWGKRCEIMRRRRASDDYLAAWFSWQPVSYPIPQGKMASR
ncbi:MAG TPA: glycosyltransferase family 2 protein [Bryobacteraceae bacterium]